MGRLDRARGLRADWAAWWRASRHGRTAWQPGRLGCWLPGRSYYYFFSFYLFFSAL
jgi:hypothetical protein